MRFKEYSSRDAAVADLAAIDKELGLPSPGVNIGDGPHAVIAAEYSKGAAGWTETECAVEDATDGSVCAVLTDAAAALGKRDVIVDGKTVSLDLTKGVLTEKPEKYRPKEALPQVLADGRKR